MVYIKYRSSKKKPNQANEIFSIKQVYMYNWHFIMCLYYVSALGIVNSDQVKDSIY